MNKILMFYN